MVQCSKCMEWYHRHCINAPADIWNNDVVWHCCSCYIIDYYNKYFKLCMFVVLILLFC